MKEEVKKDENEKRKDVMEKRREEMMIRRGKEGEWEGMNDRRKGGKDDRE